MLHKGQVGKSNAIKQEIPTAVEGGRREEDSSVPERNQWGEGGAVRNYEKKKETATSSKNEL